MNLPAPGVSLTDGPQWATDINNCLALIDQHDHSPGYGVQITPTGLNINSDLTINSNNLTSIRSTRYTPNSAVLSLPTDLDCTYVVGVDLYFNDGNGNNIRITQSGAVAGTPGSISNLSSPASASYNNINGSFVWQQAASTSADMDFGSAIMRNDTAASHGLTLSPPSAMSADYALTLPALPSVNSFLVISSAGAMAGSVPVSNGLTIQNSSIRNYTTNGSDPGINGIVSAPLGTFSNSTGGTYLAEGTPVNITTIGKSVEIWIDADGVDPTPALIITGGTSRGAIAIFRDGTLLKTNTFIPNGDLYLVPTAFRWVDINAPSGAHVYQIYINTTGGSISSNGCVLVAREVP